MNKQTVSATILALALAGLCFALLSFDFQPTQEARTQVDKQLIANSNQSPRSLVKPVVNSVSTNTPEPNARLLGVTGRVIDAGTRRPVTKATLSFEGRTTSVAVDANGRFHLPTKTTKAERLNVIAPGYLHHSQKVVPRVGFSNLLTIRLQSTAVGRIEGSVDFEGEVPEKYTIALGRQRFTFDGQRLQFEIEDVPVGQPQIGVCGAGNFANAPVVQQAVFVKANQTSKVALFVPKFAEARGVVKDEFGNPVPYADVYLGRGAVKSLANGEFEITHAFARRYRPYVHHPDFGNQWQSEIRLQKGTNKAIEFILRRQGSQVLSGQLINAVPGELMTVRVRSLANAEQVKNAPPELQKRGMSYAERTRIGHFKDGKFRFNNLPEGDYLVEAVGRSRQGGKEVKVSANSNNSMSIELRGSKSDTKNKSNQ